MYIHKHTYMHTNKQLNHDCSLNCTNSNCSNIIINATHSHSLTIHCLSESICNRLTIYTPDHQKHHHNNHNISIPFHCKLIIDNSYINNLTIYTFQGFNDTNITLLNTIPLPSTGQAPTSIGNMYCGNNFNQSCIINTELFANCMASGNNNNKQKCSHHILAPSHPNATRPRRHILHESDSDTNALIYTSIGVIFFLIFLCVIMCIIYHKTKDKFSGRLKPESYEYNRQHTNETIDSRNHHHHIPHKSSPSPSSPKVNKMKRISASSTSNTNTTTIGTGTGTVGTTTTTRSVSNTIGSSRSLSNKSNLSPQRQSFTINRHKLSPQQRQSFTPTKQMILMNNGELEIAERQKPKISISLRPVPDIGEEPLEEEDDSIDDDGKEEEEEEEEEEDGQIKRGLSDIDVDKIDLTLTVIGHEVGNGDDSKNKNNNSNGNGILYDKLAMETPTMNENEDAIIMRYGNIQKQSIKHMAVVSDSEQLMIDDDGEQEYVVHNQLPSLKEDGDITPHDKK